MASSGAVEMSHIELNKLRYKRQEPKKKKMISKAKSGDFTGFK
jgi:hypothetical protein